MTTLHEALTALADQIEQWRETAHDEATNHSQTSLYDHGREVAYEYVVERLQELLAQYADPTTEADDIRDALTHLHHQSVATALHNPTPTNQAKTTAYAKALRAAGPRP